MGIYVFIFVEKAKSDAVKSESSSSAVAAVTTAGEDVKTNTAKDEDELITVDEKMWEDVDKDLNEILQVVSDVGDEEVGNDEDEDATTTERY